MFLLLARCFLLSLRGRVNHLLSLRGCVFFAVVVLPGTLFVVVVAGVRVEILFVCRLFLVPWPLCLVVVAVVVVVVGVLCISIAKPLNEKSIYRKTMEDFYFLHTSFIAKSYLAVHCTRQTSIFSICHEADNPNFLMFHFLDVY